MTIVSKILEKLKKSVHLSDLEEQLQLLMQEHLTSQLAFCLEQLDKDLIRPYLSQGWSIDRLEERQLTFSFGTVVFKRRRLRKTGESSFLPLDQHLGLEKREHISPGFQEKVSQLATGMTFRKASECLDLLTGISLSHQTVHQICQRVAEKIKSTPVSEPTSKRKPAVLHIEGDGVWVGSKEPRKHHEFKRGCIHEGIRRQGKRSFLINPVHFGCFGTSVELFRQMADYLLTHYDLRDTIIIANSDGGSGYESDKFEDCFGQAKRYEYCLDSYHVMKQITVKTGFNKEFQGAIRQAVKAYEKEEVTLLLDTLESGLETDKQLEKVQELRGYLTKNWAAIKPINQRSVGVTDGVGICESGHRYYTNRLKKQGRNWTKEGAENMSILLLALRNGDFEERYRSQATIQPLSEELQTSASKLLKKIPHQNHTIPQASIPVYASASSPIGRLSKGFRA